MNARTVMISNFKGTLKYVCFNRNSIKVLSEL